MARTERLAELAARLSDGRPIDWPAERALSTDEEESRVVRELESIHRIVSALRTSGSGAPVPLDTGALVGKRIGTLRVDEYVGCGGMGEVYRARDERLDRNVAIKALHPSLAHDEVARRRFVRETRAACRVSHPYVATVYDVLEDEGRLLLVMEWLTGRTLSDVLGEGAVPVSKAAVYAREIAQALHAVHEAGLIHRDLKPGNVMVTPDGNVKVMDFGVALPMREDSGSPTATASVDRLTRAGRGVGTVGYMSPEQLRGGPIDRRSDLFALGVVFWELVHGRHPFSRPTPYETASAILNDPPGSGPSVATPTDTGRLGPLIGRLLEKDPARRYPDAQAFVADLDSVVSGETILDHVVERRGRLRLLWFGALGAAVALALFAILALLPRDTGGAGGSALPVVLVIPFGDPSGTGGAEDRGAMAASLVVAGLSESRSVRPVDLDRVASLVRPGAKPAGDALARSTHADWIVTGELWDEGGAVVGTAKVSRAGRSEPEATYPIHAGASSGFADLVVQRVLELIASGKGVADAAKGAERGTRSEEARKAEFAARDAMRHCEFSTAISSLERAVGLDPAFVAAHAGLAEALYRAGYGKRARAEADLAVRLTDQQGAAIPQRVGMEARAIHALVFDQVESERDLRRQLTLRYRDDPGLLASYADASRRGGHDDEAIGIAARAEAIDPGDTRPLLVSSRAHAEGGKFAEATGALDRAEAALPTPSDPEPRARIAFARGTVEMVRVAYPAAASHYQRAESLYREAKLPVLSARAHRSALEAQVLQGKLSGTESEFADALRSFRASGALQDVVDTLNIAGGRDLQAGRYAPAEQTLREAIAEARPLENPALVVYPKLNLAMLLNFTGRSSEGAGIAEEAVADARAFGLKDPEAMALSLLADTKAQQGRFRESREAFLAVADLGRAPGGPGGRLGFALYSAAELDELMGAVTPGLREIEEAVKALREGNQGVELTSALIIRSRLRSQSADWKGSEADLDEAARLIKSAGTEMEESTLRLELARAIHFLRRGDWPGAAKKFRDVRRGAAKLTVISLEVPALIGLCRAELEEGSLSDAERDCHDADVHVRALPSERAYAHATLAAVLEHATRPDEAQSLALRAFGEAEEMGLATVGIEAGAIVARVPSKTRHDDVIGRAGEIARNYLDAFPPERRDLIRRRPDLEPALMRLTSQPR